jgi:outer membrane protein OmpA-like peptidoglycan-associated protein
VSVDGIVVVLRDIDGKFSSRQPFDQLAFSRDGVTMTRRRARAEGRKPPMITHNARHGVATGFALITLLLAASCASDSSGGRQHVAAPSAIPNFSAPSGNMVAGDRQARARAILGTGVGALAPTDVTAYVDREERDMRAKAAGTGVDVRRRGDSLLLIIPAAISFDGEGAAVRPGFRTTLDQIARVLSQYRQSYIDIAGYAEVAATPLPQNRAQSVGSYLQLRGVTPAQIATQGYAAAPSEVAPGRPAGARIEIHLVPLTQADIAAPVHAKSVG